MRRGCLRGSLRFVQRSSSNPGQCSTTLDRHYFMGAKAEVQKSESFSQIPGLVSGEAEI